jgi:hypothetical protein
MEIEKNMIRPPLNMSERCSLKKKRADPITPTWQQFFNDMPDFFKMPNDLRKRQIFSFELTPSSLIPHPPPGSKFQPGKLIPAQHFWPCKIGKTYLPLLLFLGISSQFMEFAGYFSYFLLA